MRLAYLTRFDVSNRSTAPTLGGAGYASYYIARNLQALGMSVLGVHGLTSGPSFAASMKAAFYRRVHHQNYNFAADPLTLKRQARQIGKKLAPLDYDIVLSRLVLPLAHLQLAKPIAVWTDGSARGLIDFYPQLTNLSERSRRETLAMERAALEKCRLIIYSSDWAAQHAPASIDRAKIKVVPFGPNCEAEATLDEVCRNAHLKPMRPCRLLFVGGAWERKGGIVACQLAKALCDAGYPTELTIVGCTPKIPSDFAGIVKVVGYLHRSSPDGERAWRELMQQSHFLILPSRADCTPHVLMEANSYGVPCLTTDVGGIPTVIRNEVNGKLFAVDADIRDYRDFVITLLDDPNRYERLALSSFREFQTRLNWRVACENVKAMFDAIA